MSYFLTIYNKNNDYLGISKPEFSLVKRPERFISDIKAGFYSRCEQHYADAYFSVGVYRIYWGLTRPTKRQFRQMKKKLRREE